MLNFTNIELLYGVFNKFVFPEAKMNIQNLREYYKNDPSLRNNTLIERLLEIIANKKFDDITDATYISALQEDGKSDAEVETILRKIKEYSAYSSEQVVDIRTHIEKLCCKAFVDKTNRAFGSDIVKYINELKKFEYKSNFSSTLVIKNFKELEIDDLIEMYFREGYKSRYEFINNTSICGGYIPGQIVQVVGAPGTGKSLFLQGEAVNFIEQGDKRVHYLAMGDLNELDLVMRMTCMLGRIPKWELEKNIKKYFYEYQDKFENLGITAIPSGVVTATEYVNYISNTDFDILMIDYDSGFKTDPELTMYDQYGEVYNLFTRLTRQGKLLFVACQPKIAFWGDENLDLQSAGESARKQHISDVVITIGRKKGSKNMMGKFNIAKARRTENADQYWIRTSEGLFYPCSDNFYRTYSLEEKRLYSYKELEERDFSEAVIAGAIKGNRNKKKLSETEQEVEDVLDIARNKMTEENNIQDDDDVPF